MVTLEEIENSLSTDTTDGGLATSIFREILTVLSFDESICGQLDLTLQSLETLLPIAESLDHRYTSVWPRWASTIQKIRGILKNQIPEIAAKKSRKPTNPWHGKMGKYPLLACLCTSVESSAHSGLTPAKAILLIRAYGCTQNDGTFSTEYPEFEKFLADSIRKSCSGGADPFWKLVPPWNSADNAAWHNSFLDSTQRFRSVSFQSKYPIRTNFQVIRALRITLELVSRKDGLDTNSNPHHPAPRSHSLETPLKEQNQSVVFQPLDAHEEALTKKNRAKRTAFNYIYNQSTAADSDAVGLALESVHVVPQADTHSDQPTPPSSVQSLDVRYTNYRTAMDNQRLPWQWDCLNAFEVKAVRAALLDSSETQGTSLSEKQGAFIVWLLLATGQTIDEILKFDLGLNQSNWSAIVSGPIYIRNVTSPPHSFVPKSGQQKHLYGHSPSVSLALPAPFPTLVSELGLVDSNITPIKSNSTIGACLNLDSERAEQAVRSFLENHRTRSFRLLPGRVRKVLSKEIMRVTNDPVATHILSSLPTDMPPAGVYYTSYSKEQLESIYAEALARVLGGDT